MALIIGLVVIALIVFMIIGLYNSLVQLRVRADSAWSDIDVQLKRRHDLIPNIVETVKGYAAHEKGTFENIAKWRSAAMGATTPEDRAQAEGQLTMALKGLFAVAEAYPELKTNEQFMQLQTRITGLENGIADRRELYNEAVNIYNVGIEQFPAVLVANMFAYTQKPLLEFAAAEKTDVDIKSLFS